MRKYSVVVSCTPLIERTIIVEAENEYKASSAAKSFCEKFPPDIQVEPANEFTTYPWDMAALIPANFGITDCQEASRDEKAELNQHDKEAKKR